VDEPHLKTLHDLLDEAVALKEQTGKLVAEITANPSLHLLAR
jgi:hypothetical protein